MDIRVTDSRGALRFWLGERKPVLLELASEEGVPFSVSEVVPLLARGAMEGPEAPAAIGPPSVSPSEGGAGARIVFALEPLERGRFVLWVKYRVGLEWKFIEPVPVVVD